MKLATQKNNTRDGRLIVVSSDNTRYATPHIETMQHALDNWDSCLAELQTLSEKLNSDNSFGHPVDVSTLTAPLPRAYEWVDGSAYINHIVLVRKARNAEPPETLRRANCEATSVPHEHNEKSRRPHESNGW